MFVILQQRKKNFLPFSHDMTQIFVVTHILLLFSFKTCRVRPTSMRCLFSLSFSNHLFLCVSTKKEKKKNFWVDPHVWLFDFFLESWGKGRQQFEGRIDLLIVYCRISLLKFLRVTSKDKVEKSILFKFSQHTLIYISSLNDNHIFLRIKKDFWVSFDVKDMQKHTLKRFHILFWIN